LDFSLPPCGGDTAKCFFFSSESVITLHRVSPTFFPTNDSGGVFFCFFFPPFTGRDSRLRRFSCRFFFTSSEKFFLRSLPFFAGAEESPSFSFLLPFPYFFFFSPPTSRAPTFSEGGEDFFLLFSFLQMLDFSGFLPFFFFLCGVFGRARLAFFSPNGGT